MRLIFLEAHSKGGVPVPKRAFVARSVSLIAFLLAGLQLNEPAVAQKERKAAPPATEKVIAIRAATLVDGVANQARHNVLIR